MDTIPKQLNIELDPNLETTRDLDHKYSSVLIQLSF